MGEFSVFRKVRSGLLRPLLDLLDPVKTSGRFLSLEMQTLDAGSSSPVQLITVSPRALAAPEAARAPPAPSAVPGTISGGGAAPPNPLRCIFVGP